MPKPTGAHRVTKISEPEARALYVRMKGKRSIRKLHAHLEQHGYNPPTLRTFENWAIDNEWSKLAKERDARVNEAVMAAGIEIDTKDIVKLSSLYRDIGKESLRKALAALKGLDFKGMRPHEIKALFETAEKAMAAAEVVEGRNLDDKMTSDEHLTRSGLDQIFDQMAAEVTKRAQDHAEREKNARLNGANGKASSANGSTELH